MVHRTLWRALGAGTASLLAFSVVPGAPVQAATEVVYTVTTSGSGTTCSTSRPCTLDAALTKLAGATASMTSDVVVRLQAGTYRRTSPITLRSAHSGRNGHQVRIEAAAGASVTVSGGRVVTGWRLSNSSRNIWRAAVPSGFQSRQLFVDGVRARMASGTTQDVLGSLTTTSTGYTAAKSTVASWSDARSAELVFPAGGEDPGGEPGFTPWSWTMCGVESASGRTVTVDRGCWRNARAGFQAPDGSTLPFITKPTRVQNAYALLDEAGEFYLDRSASYVYYKPRAGENLSTASVVMPQATSLVDADDVADLTLSGIEFEHATWIPDADLGVFAIQANVIASTADFAPHKAGTVAAIPSALSFTRAQGVLLDRLTVRRTGGGGISFNGGGSGNTVRGAVVSDVAANGITVSEGTGLATADSYETDSVVEQSVVRDVGVEYLSAVGIMAGWVARVTVRDNVVERTPHVGIGVGWGWMNEGEMVDNHVRGNVVHDTMQSQLSDGGAIYVQGRQASTAMSTIIDNHVSGDHRDYGAIYLDSGASHWLVTNNVVEDVSGAGWLFLQNIAAHGMAFSNLVAGNYSDTDEMQEAPLGLHDSNLVVQNALDRADWTPMAEEATASAGPKGAYAALR